MGSNRLLTAQTFERETDVDFIVILKSDVGRVFCPGCVLNPIPWAYQVFIHWGRMFVLYGAD
jgi:hypothetical protein